MRCGRDAQPADAEADAAPSAITRQAALYKPAAWVPHCTLAMNLDAGSLGRAFRALHPYAGLQARVTSVCLVDIETGDAEDLARLSGPAAASGNAGCW